MDLSRRFFVKHTGVASLTAFGSTDNGAEFWRVRLSNQALEEGMRWIREIRDGVGSNVVMLPGDGAATAQTVGRL